MNRPAREPSNPGRIVVKAAEPLEYEVHGNVPASKPGLSRTFVPPGWEESATMTFVLRIVELTGLFSVRLNVVVAETFICVVPLTWTFPMPLSIEALDVFDDDHESVTVPPPVGRVEGVAVKDPVGAALATVTVAVSLLEPMLFFRESWNTFDELTFTGLDPIGGTLPIPLSMDALSALAEIQDNWI